MFIYSLYIVNMFIFLLSYYLSILILFEFSGGTRKEQGELPLWSMRIFMMPRQLSITCRASTWVDDTSSFCITNLPNSRNVLKPKKSKRNWRSCDDGLMPTRLDLPRQMGTNVNNNLIIWRVCEKTNYLEQMGCSDRNRNGDP